MMNRSNPTLHAASCLFLLLSFSTICIGNKIIFCPEIEKMSLLNLKQSLEDPSNQLSSWDDELSCCKWEGVICSNSTGLIHELRLGSLGLRGKINPSLLNLKKLRYLDLSQNSFDETIPSFIGQLANLEYLNLSVAGFHGKISHSIGNISNLRILALDGDEMNADSLEWLSGLSRLEYLSMNYVNLSKVTNWAQVINSLPSLLQLHFKSCSLDFMASPNDANITRRLTFLDLSYNNFHSLAILKWIFQLSNLLFLDFTNNNLEGPLPPLSNATKLHYINLSTNSFNSTIPDWFFLCRDLEVVDLRYNHLSGTLISNSVANLTSLTYLVLYGNQISGTIPREITNLCKMQTLDLAYNNLQGEMSESFGNMSNCFFNSLQYLDLGGNSLSGSIPISLQKLSSLEFLTLYGNKLTGNLPESLGQLSNLEQLWIGENKLKGVVTEIHFANLTKLETFSAYGNHLSLKVSPNWIPPSQLGTLELGSWNLGAASQIPQWLKMQMNIQALDISSCGIFASVESVPSWFWEIQYLNLSNNHFHGKIPYIPGDKQAESYIYLSSNQFSGSLPPIRHNLVELDLSNNTFSGGISHFLCDMKNETHQLQNLHLRGNQLTGELPDCWEKFPYLKFVNLGNNNMSETIPDSIGFLAYLRSLNLYNNRFSGRIPFSMHNCKKLVKIDLSGNDLDGDIPTWIGTSLVKLRILILRSNNFSGKIYPEICRLNTLQILDLSDNEISGVIPSCVYNFTSMVRKRSSLFEHDSEESSYTYSIYGAFGESVSITTKGSELMYDTILPLVTNIDLSKNNLSGEIPKELTSLVELRSLNLSENHFTGSIPDSIGNMKQLESLDFSRNSLSGEIPSSFKLLSSLNHLVLSYNNLTGKIPESTQLQSFDASSFIGNNLCGPPLTSNCSKDGSEEDEDDEDEDESDESEIEWCYVFLSLGYAVGFSAVCTILVFKKPWRDAYFGLLERMWTKLQFNLCELMHQIYS